MFHGARPVSLGDASSVDASPAAWRSFSNVAWQPMPPVGRYSTSRLVPSPSPPVEAASPVNVNVAGTPCSGDPGDTDMLRVSLAEAEAGSVAHAQMTMAATRKILRLG